MVKLDEKAARARVKAREMYSGDQRQCIVHQGARVEHNKQGTWVECMVFVPDDPKAPIYVTIDTVTDEQIRELRHTLYVECHELEGEAWMGNRHQATECEIALGIKRAAARGHKRRARGRCVGWINDRLKKAAI